MPADFDVNRYALSVELALSQEPVMKAIDALTQQVGKIEETASRAAQEALGIITDQAKQTAQFLEDVVQQFTQSAAQAQELEPPLQQAQQSIGQIFTNQQELQELDQDKLDHLVRWIKDLQRASKLFNQEIESAESVLRSIQQTEEAIVAKNRRHGEQNAAMLQTQQLAQHINDEFDDQVIHLHDILHVAGRLAGVVIGLVAAWELATDATERFHTANFRVLGGQMEIVYSASQLTRQYGILQEQALETYEALGNLKIPREEIEALAAQVSRYNRITGVGINTLADYVARMRAIGFSAAGSEQRLATLTETMRKWGLNTQDISKIMGDTTTSARTLIDMFGGNKDIPIQIDLLKASYLKLSQQLSGTTREGELLNKSLDALLSDQNLIGLSQMAALTGKWELTSIEDFQEGLRAVGKALAREFEKSKGMGMYQRSYMDRIIKQYGILDIDAARLLAQQAELKAAVSGTAEAFDKQAVAILSAGEALRITEKEYADATESVYRQFREMGQQFRNIWRDIQLLVGPFLTTVAFVLKLVVTVIASVLHAFNWVVLGIDSVFSSINGGLPIVRWFVGLLITVGLIAVDVVGILVGVFGGLFGFLGTIFGGIVTALGAGLTAFLGAITTAVTTLGTALAGALAALGAAITPVMLPLLALGGALALAGLGAYLLAQAVLVIARSGQEGAIALGGLTVAIVAITAVLAIAGVAAAGAAPGLLAVGGALLMIGAGVWLATTGIAALTRVVWGIVAAIGPNSPPLWEKFSLVAAGLRAISAVAKVVTTLLKPLWSVFDAIAGGARRLWESLGQAGGIGQLLGAAIKQMASWLSELPSLLAWLAARLGELFKSVLGAPASLLATAAALAVLTGALVLAGTVVGPVLPVLAGIMAVVWGLALAAQLTAGALGQLGAQLGALGPVLIKLGPALLATAAGMAGVTLASAPFGLALAGLAAESIFVSGRILKLGNALQAVANGAAGMVSNLGPLQGIIAGLGTAVAQLHASLATVAADQAALEQLGAAINQLGARADSASGPLWYLGLALGMAARGATVVNRELTAITQAMHSSFVEARELLELFQRVIPVFSQVARSMVDVALAALWLIPAGLVVGAFTVALTLASIALAPFLIGVGVLAAVAVAAALAMTALLVATGVAAVGMIILAGAAVVAAVSLGAITLIAIPFAVAVAAIGFSAAGAAVGIGALGGALLLSIPPVLAASWAWRRLAATTTTIAQGINQALRGMVQLRATTEGLSRALAALGAAVNPARLNAALLELGNSLLRVQLAYQVILLNLAGLNLAGVIGQQVVAIGTAVDAMAAVLDRYAELLEHAVNRVEMAILKRAVPAMLAARDIGIEEVVQANTVATVMVNPEQEGGEDKRSPELEAMVRNNALLTQILEAIGLLGDSKIMTELRDVLASGLRGTQEGGSRMGQMYNDWRV